MKTDEFLKDFIGDNEIVTVNASQLKKAYPTTGGTKL